ncbi:MAG: hypothetical protein ACFB4J_10325 [Elainellaceae cyanobacterium]
MTFNLTELDPQVVEDLVLDITQLLQEIRGLDVNINSIKALLGISDENTAGLNPSILGGTDINVERVIEQTRETLRTVVVRFRDIIDELAEDVEDVDIAIFDLTVTPGSDSTVNAGEGTSVEALGAVVVQFREAMREIDGDIADIEAALAADPVVIIPLEPPIAVVPELPTAVPEPVAVEPEPISVEPEPVAVEPEAPLEPESPAEEAPITSEDGISAQPPLSPGTAIADQFDGITISTPDHAFGAMLFDTSNPTGGDSDLATNQEGLVLIISEDGNGANPDDNAAGGTLRFEFDALVGVSQVGVLDIEESGGLINAYSATGDLIEAVEISSSSNNSLQDVAVNASGVSYLDIVLVGSGAVTSLEMVSSLDAAQVLDFDQPFSAVASTTAL